MKIRQRATIASVELSGEDDFYLCGIHLTGHDDAINVYGKNIDECIERAIIIKRAFNGSSGL